MPVTSNDAQTPEERRNIELVTEYMTIAYDPKRASGQAVAYLCTPGNRLVAPTTFPGVETLEGYADAHAKVKPLTLAGENAGDEFDLLEAWSIRSSNSSGVQRRPSRRMSQAGVLIGMAPPTS